MRILQLQLIYAVQQGLVTRRGSRPEFAIVNGYTDRYSDNRCSDSQSRPPVGLGRFMILDRQGESERFRCVGITLAEIYENKTTRRDKLSSV